MVDEVLECVGALIFDPLGRMFVQRRSADRTLFPHCWDVAGGHVEPGETPEDTLRREVAEETGWRVKRVHAQLEPMRWRGDDGKDRLEYDFLVEVEGDLDRPALELGKHSEWRWLSAAETDLLDQNRRVGDSLIKELIELGFDKAQRIGLSPAFASVVAPLVDRAFIDTMAAARDSGGRELVARYGLPHAGPLIDYRLILPARPLSPSERDVINRYSDPDGLHRGFLESQDHGMVTVAADGTVTATAKGLAFYQELWQLHGRVADARLRPMPVLAEIVSHCEGGPAFQTVNPPYLPPDATPALRAFAHLAVLRYHRADAHAAALAGDAAPEQIEAETNRLADAAFGELTASRRFELLREVRC